MSTKQETIIESKGVKRMGRNIRTTICMAVTVGLFFAAGAQAGKSVPDVISMDNQAYETHKKGIVQFSHKKHIEQYRLGCGECHHDDACKPLDSLKEGDEVQNCIVCHKIPGQVPKKMKKVWKAEKLTKAAIRKKKLAYHAEAMHYNCIGCHKDVTKKNKTKSAPTTCSKCHPKK
jgi:hypothetical protein